MSSFICNEKYIDPLIVIIVSKTISLGSRLNLESFSFHVYLLVEAIVFFVIIFLSYHFGVLWDFMMLLLMTWFDYKLFRVLRILFLSETRSRWRWRLHYRLLYLILNWVQKARFRGVWNLRELITIDTWQVFYYDKWFLQLLIFLF
jgi:hypothetical protein